jgi:pimeloyl-ACP methyl ester carboxylesterase
MVCLHGFTDTWRTWDLVRPALERHHEVHTPALAGHADGPPLPPDAGETVLVDVLERWMDDAGLEAAHLVGNSLGGHLALQLAARGRARTVVALAPAGGWARGDTSYLDTLALQERMVELARSAAPHADTMVSTLEGRRQATASIVTRFEHIPAALIAAQIRAMAACDGAARLIALARTGEWELDAERIGCPLRIVWGTGDRLLPWPRAAARYRAELPHADWVELDGVGHCPQLDVPLETAQLSLGFS